MKPSKFLAIKILLLENELHVGTFMHGFFPSGRIPRSISGVEKRAVLL